MIAKRESSVWTILVCSLCLLACGCDLTLGPLTKTKTVIVAPGTGIEVLENRTVKGRVLGQKQDADGVYDLIRQDVGGWVAMHPDHWDAVKSTVTALRSAYAAKIKKHGDTLTAEDRALLGLDE